MDNKNFQRVYINPNFNRATASSSHYLANVNSVHLNAHFTTTQNKKIYINPNFIQSTISQAVHCTNQYSWQTKKETPSLSSSCLTNADLSHDNLKSRAQLPVAKKSRYCLVRHNENKPPATKSEKPETLTVKLSKYKSVRISDVKLDLNKVKQVPKQLRNADKPVQSHSFDQKQRERHTNVPYNEKEFKAKYTYVKSKENAVNTSLKAFKTKYSYIKSKEMAKKINTTKHTSTNMTVKNASRLKIRKLKVKCNTPCRLFRKYGKCLRNVKGHCKYLHDKKHVSICRKFLKGICHDKHCLLSHELSDKKMPTCYFYLQGMCAKENCPYLHVKVNENAIVCPDFKKGYCERGNKCLYRHVETTKKRGKKLLVDSKTRSVYKLKIKHSNGKTKTSENGKIIIENYKRIIKEDHDQTAVTEGRYYKEIVVDGETSELYQVIKPTRCKLGTLPSFIKL